MGSFEKNLNKFLESATEHQVITKDNADSLIEFSKSDEYENRGWFSLSAAMGGLGAFVLCLGISLIIAKNWHSFSDITKISGFLFLLGGTHFAGLYLTDKGYGRTAMGLHLLGAGLVLAGIGLMGQMFQLYYSQGKSFFAWFVMILPLAFLLRNGPILLLSVVAFILWGNEYISDTLGYYRYEIHHITFNAAVCVGALLFGLLLKFKNNEMGQYLQVPAMILAVIGLYVFGFSHNFGYFKYPEQANLVSYTILLASFSIAIYLYVNSKKKFDKYFILSVSISLIPILLLCTAYMFEFDKDSYFKHFSFGWTRKIYYLPLMISVSCWIGYFALAFWGVIYGSLNHHRWMLNCNIILIGIGVFTRFIDLVGNMLDTGIMFVVCGLFLFAVGFGLEKWRRKLIANAQDKGAANG